MSYYKINNLEEYFKHYKKISSWTQKILGQSGVWKFTWYQEWDKVRL
jgi:acetyl-CoA synthetase